MPVRDNREDELRAQKAREAQAAEEAAKAKAAEEARAAAEAAAKAEAQKAAEEAQKAAEKKAEPAPAPAPQEPAKPAPRTFSGPIVPTRPAFNPRPINRPAPTGDGQRNQNRDGNRGGNFQNRDGRPGYQNRDGNRGGNFQNRDGNRPGFQNRDGSRPGFQNRDGNRPGFQNRDGRPASQGGRGFYDKDKDADTQSRGGQGRGPQSGRPGGRPQEGGFGDRPLQKQQNNKQNKNAYKDKNSRFDRDEEKRLESAADPSPHIRRACAVVGTVRSQHIFCSRPDIRLLPAFRFLCVFSTVSPLAASDYTFPEQYLRLLPFPCDLLHTLFLRIRFNGMIFQTSLYAVFTKHHGPR